ncbi:MAG: peptidylprolyl isomerase [Fimbriimonadaceae bacterium]|nr:peptidylprolyl isomerase [Fimbriimonadaceae bacterium]
MRKTPDPEAPAPRSGPPPLRTAPVKKPPKPKKRGGWREFIDVLLHPSVNRLRSDLGHILKIGLGAFVVIFVVGTLVSFGSSGPRDEERRAGNQVPQIAKLNGTALTREDFQKQLAAFGLLRDEVLTMRFQQTGQMFDRWVDEQLLAQEAKRRGVKVGKDELTKELGKNIDQALKAKRGDLSERDYLYRLQQEGKTERQIRDELRAEINQDALRATLVEKKVREAIEAEVKVEEKDLAEKYDEIGGQVILVKCDTRKPPPKPTDREESADELKTRTDQEAAYEKSLAAKKPEAAKLLAKVKAAPAQFEAFAKSDSKDYTAQQGGKFGPANREAYDVTRFGDDFKKVAFGLPLGQVSDLIKADEGWVIVKLNAKKAWPADFSKPDPRSLDEAKKIADGLYAQLQKGADFGKLAKEKSEDPGSKDKGGEYDMTGRGTWVKPFEKMAFALAPKELSKPFKTQFGYHIMQLLDRELPKGDETVKDDEPDPNEEFKTEEQKKKDEAELKALPLPQHADLPKALKVKVRHILIKGEDPQQKLEDKRKQLLDEKKAKHYDETLKKLRDEAYKSQRVRVFDPAIQAYLAGKDNKKDEQLFYLRQAAALWPNDHPDVHYELGKQYEQQTAFGPEAGKSKVAAAAALAKMPGPATEAALLKAVDTFEPDVRKAVINSLGEIKAKSATSKLQELVRTDPDDSVAKAAEAALQKIGAEVPKRLRASNPVPPASLGVGGKPTSAPVEQTPPPATKGTP